MRRLKAYGGHLDGRMRLVVVAESRVHVQKLLHAAGARTSLHYLAQYWSETHNEHERALISRGGAGVWIYPYSRSCVDPSGLARFESTPAVSSIWGWISNHMKEFEAKETAAVRALGGEL